MTEPIWIDLGPAEEFPNSAQRCLTIEGTPIVLINADGVLYALENICPHAGRPLGDGEHAGLTLTCPYHGYTYNIKTGKNIDAPEEEAPVKTYPVRTEGGRVSIQLTQNDKDEA